MIGQAIARRVSIGRHILLADLHQENVDATTKVLSDAGFEVSTAVIHAAGVSPTQASSAVRSELLKLILPTRQESGCIEYNLHQDNQYPAVFVFYETWESTASVEKHISTDHYNAYFRALDGMIKEKVVNKMTLIE